MLTLFQYLSPIKYSFGHPYFSARGSIRVAIMGALGRSEAPTKEIVKPLTFKAQEFRHIKLDNHMEFLLVSDPELDKAGAAVDVRVGSMSDPKDTPGLAHFCEHMLFYASEKFPEEDAYSRFLSEHGGHTNAYTAAEDTNYHFDCNTDALDEAVDRFAQFFIAPLISEDGVEREVNAVDSEHSKNLNTDAWRKMQLWRHTSSGAHPFNRFSTGNIDTLLHTPKARGQQPHEVVSGFHMRYYSANLMRGALVAAQPMQELEALVRAKFGAVPNADLAQPAFSPDVVTEAEQGQILRVVPEREGHRLDLQWAVPPEQQVYRAAPCAYLGHLIGHEGEGSLFALLKERRWATSLSAGEGSGSFSARSFFSIGVTLTDEGFDHVEEIVALCFAYIRLVSAQGGVSEKAFQQYRDLAQLRFNFADKQGPLAMATSLSSHLQEVPPQDVLLAMHNVAQEFDADAIHAVLEQLTPQKLRMMLASKRFKGMTTQTEPWYSTEYSQEPIPSAWLRSWQEAAAPAALHLPRPNPFISSDFTLIQVAEGEGRTPVVLHDTPLLKLWHKPSVQFETPNAVVYLHFACPEAYVSPEAAVLTRLAVRLLSDDLNAMAYDAELAGLGWSAGSTTEGLLVTFYGYSHKLMELVRKVLARLGDLPVKPDRFLVQQEALAKEYANTRYEQPYQTAMYEAAVALHHRRWHTREYEAVVGKLAAPDLEAFLGRLTARCSVEGYVTGNFSAGQAAELAGVVDGLLKDTMRANPLFPSQRPERRVVRLRPGAPALLAQPVPNEANANSAVVLAFQVGPDCLRRNALLQLAVQCCKRDAFHTLRTVEQLGYMVWMSTWSTLTVQNLAFVVQSAAFPADHLEARVEAFVGAMHSRLADLDEAAFASQVEELAKAKLERPKRLRQLAAREWREIDDGTLVWERPAAEVAALRTLSKADLLAFYQEVVHDMQSRRKLSVHILGSEKARAEEAANSNGTSAEEAAHPLPAADSTATEQAEHGGEPDAAEDGAAVDGEQCKGRPAVHVEPVTDLWAFKRAQEVFASLK